MKSYFCVGMHILPARLCGCNKNPFIQKWIELDEMKRIEKYKKVDEIEKLLNFLFIVWSVCFLFTNTDKSLAFSILLSIYLWGSPLLHFVNRLRRQNAFSNIIT